MSDERERLEAEDSSSVDRPLDVPAELPILPLRDTVLFPNSFMPLAVAREMSVKPDRGSHRRPPADRRLRAA